MMSDNLNQNCFNDMKMNYNSTNWSNGNLAMVYSILLIPFIHNTILIASCNAEMLGSF